MKKLETTESVHARAQGSEVTGIEWFEERTNKPFSLSLSYQDFVQEVSPGSKGQVCKCNKKIPQLTLDYHPQEHGKDCYGSLLGRAWTNCSKELYDRLPKQPGQVVKSDPYQPGQTQEDDRGYN